MDPNVRSPSSSATLAIPNGVGTKNLLLYPALSIALLILCRSEIGAVTKTP